MRSLRTDHAARSVVALSLGTLVIAAWTTWLFMAKMAVYVQSSEARIEVDRFAHPLQAPVGGRIIALNVALGREVHAGDVLVEFDVDPQRLELLQARARFEALGPEIEAARQETALLAAVENDDRAGTTASVAEANAQFQQAKTQAAAAQQELERSKKLRSEGLASEQDLARAQSDAAQKLAAADASRAAVGRIASIRKADSGDRRARRQNVERDIATLEGERLTVKAQISRLENEVARRTLVAAVDGQVAEIAEVTVGSVVHEGDRLGAILPVGRLRGVAEVLPGEALGRVRIGQPARLRLDAFPWAQHGTVSATVSRVAGEVRDGRLRIELDIDWAHTHVPLQHGLRGQAEIEVERASPAILVLRAAGRMVTGQSAAPAPTSSAAPTPSP